MTKVKLNPIIEELRGKLGDIVFREVNGQTVMGRIPSLNGNLPSEEQLEVRDRFRQAAVYGRMVLADPETRTLYADAAARKGQPVFSVIMADFLNTPIVDEVDVSEYNGGSGSSIYIRTHDDFAVQRVHVRIALVSSGELLEEGDAVVDPGTGRWVYSAQSHVDGGNDVQITVTVTDRPGGEGISQLTKTFSD